jgi:hypothetical protein
MRTLYGIRIPDGARGVEVRALAGSRPRFIFRGALEEHGILVTEDLIADQVADDHKFWDWVGAQIKQRRISVDNATDGGVVRLKLSISFMNQDASKAILDESSGATSIVTEEAQEFHKGSSTNQETSQMAIIEKLLNSMTEQQKELPAQLTKMLTAATEAGQSVIQTTAAESSKILTALVEPLKAQMQANQKYLEHEMERADEAHKAVVDLLMSKGETGESPLDNFFKIVEATPAILKLLEKLTKQVGN